MTKTWYVPDIPLPDPDPQPPSFTMPRGAWDTHFHVIDPGYGFVENRSYTPHAVTLGMLRSLHAALGIERGVFIQVSAHGTDNRALLDALAVMPHYRGVCVVPDTVTEDELNAFHRAGVRGARVNVLFGGGVGFEALAGLGRRLADRGWHMQLLMDITHPETPWDDIAALPCEVIVDHMGHWNAAAPDPESGETGVAHPAFQRLLALVADGAWVKLSGAERISGRETPPFDNVVPLAQTLIAAAPDRCVWGSDWPHVKLPIPMPNTGALLEQLATWAPDPDLCERILVQNPARLYLSAD